MRVAINGAGIAGPTLAWWLKRYGYEPVIFEKAPTLRKGGYVIDFWGAGYDIAEKMGLLPELKEQGYLIENLCILNRNGTKNSNINTMALTKAVNNRFLTIRRSDLAATLYHACKNTGVEIRFGEHILAVEQHHDAAVVSISNGQKEKFDLVIGADGLHSQIRSNVFGSSEHYEKDIGAYVVAFTLSNYEPRDELTYMICPVPTKQAARVSLRDNKTLFLFTFRSELLKSDHQNENDIKTILASIYGDMGWPEVNKALSNLDNTDDFYFDRVSQIHMDKWSKNRVALIGDAAACASLLAGEGSGLAMIEAYVLAGELYKANGNYELAFQKYEDKLKSFLMKNKNRIGQPLSLCA
ncbi:FAD-binding domain [Legionella tunisiensis]|uniref:FAD-binding domain n=1 Tax=Legionella tunisiensis TaxID=1034944 RepID=UPI000302D01D|nr:FAD-binding domain [Legionella tunisiensis]